jgi:hypothetical protein
MRDANTLNYDAFAISIGLQFGSHIRERGIAREQVGNYTVVHVNDFLTDEVRRIHKLKMRKMDKLRHTGDLTDGPLVARKP